MRGMPSRPARRTVLALALRSACHARWDAAWCPNSSVRLSTGRARQVGRGSRSWLRRNPVMHRASDAASRASCHSRIPAWRYRVRRWCVTSWAAADPAFRRGRGQCASWMAPQMVGASGSCLGAGCRASRRFVQGRTDVQCPRPSQVARLVLIVRSAAMHRATVVPDHHVADAPVVPVDEHRLRCMHRQVGMTRPLAGRPAATRARSSSTALAGFGRRSRCAAPSLSIRTDQVWHGPKGTISLHRSSDGRDR
jgi:hypothetical protein